MTISPWGVVCPNLGRIRELPVQEDLDDVGLLAQGDVVQADHLVHKVGVGQQGDGLRGVQWHPFVVVNARGADGLAGPSVAGPMCVLGSLT